MQKHRNCGLPEYQGERDSDFEMALGTEVIKECPNSLIQHASVTLWDLFWSCHSAIEGGIIMSALPKAGGLLDQDNLTMQAFAVIKNEEILVSREEIRNLQNK